MSHGCLWAQPGTATVRCPAFRRSTWCIQHLPSRRARNGTPQRTCGNLFTSPPDEIYWRTVADVAELADAPDSKSGTRKGVWVRPPPSAPCKGRTCKKSLSGGDRTSSPGARTLHSRAGEFGSPIQAGSTPLHSSAASDHDHEITAGCLPARPLCLREERRRIPWRPLRRPEVPRQLARDRPNGRRDHPNGLRVRGKSIRWS